MHTLRGSAYYYFKACFPSMVVLNNTSYLHKPNCGQCQLFYITHLGEIPSIKDHLDLFNFYKRR